VSYNPLRGKLSAVAPAVMAALVYGCATTAPALPNLDATLWVQTAAEYEAVSRSVYESAIRSLPSALNDATRTAALEQQGSFADLPPAVIVDVDETVLDNSPYQARLLIEGQDYDSASWASWVDEASAEAVPGALGFATAATNLGITVFYLTNRLSSQEEATRRNLESLGFPVREDMDVILTRGERPEWTGAKISRRQVVAGTHRVLMMVGDDLNDFLDVGGLTVSERSEVTALYADYWGNRWWMLPGPTYGSWERALWEADYDLDAAERIERKVEYLDPETRTQRLEQ